MSDGWANAFTGFGSGFLEHDERDVVHATGGDVEADDSLRDRILYVAGDSASLVHELGSARGAQLDDIAERYLLRRRGTK